MSLTKMPTGLDALFDGNGVLHAPDPKNTKKGTPTSVAPSSKRCARCGRLLLISEFRSKSSSVDGKQPYCKGCQNEANKEYKKKLKAPGVERQSACPYCSFKGTAKGLGQHISKSHPEKCTHVCMTCGFRSYSKRGLELHQLYNHSMAASPTVEEAPEVSELVCKECGFVCHCRSGLSRHMAAHHPQSCKHKCNVCGAMLYSRSALEGHIGTAHADTIQSTKNASEVEKAVAEPLEAPPRFKYLGNPGSDKIGAILAIEDPELFDLLLDVVQSLINERDTKPSSQGPKPEEKAIEAKSKLWARFKARWSR